MTKEGYKVGGISRQNPPPSLWQQYSDHTHDTANSYPCMPCFLFNIIVTVIVMFCRSLVDSWHLKLFVSVILLYFILHSCHVSKCVSISSVCINFHQQPINVSLDSYFSWWYCILFQDSFLWFLWLWNCCQHLKVLLQQIFAMFWIIRSNSNQK